MQNSNKIDPKWIQWFIGLADAELGTNKSLVLDCPKARAPKKLAGTNLRTLVLDCPKARAT